MQKHIKEVKVMAGNCTQSLLQEIASTQEMIKNFSARAEGQSDDMVLWMAQNLVESIQNMIEQKQIVKDNMNA